MNTHPPAGPSLDTLRALTAPTGTLRVALNLGNPLLVHLNTQGQPEGVSVDLAHAYAERLGLPLSFQIVKVAAESVAAVTDAQADIGFVAVDPVRGAGIRFTAPYLLIQGAYAVRQDSPLQANDEVDRAGHHIVVGQGSAYDLYLSREIRHATLVRAASSQAVVQTFVEQGHTVAAGVRQQLEADLARFPGHRLLPSHFMVIQQAMGVPKTRDAAVGAALAQFVEDMKASGFVAAALQRHGVQGAGVAPAA
jgi:polar amino acid transport system substrate-binding protein